MTTGRGAAGYFAHTLMALIFTSIGAATVIFGQEIEAYFLPVVGETRPADGFYRDKVRACFVLHLAKLREATQPRYLYDVQAKQSLRLPVSIYVSDTHRKKFGEDLVTHDFGKTWDRVFCFELPDTISNNQSITLYGHAEHKRHFGWRSLTYLQPFKICGLTADDPPPDVPIKPDPYCDKQREGFAMLTTPSP